jgi:phosphoglycerol transferase MdoB-like AlkP superfamily enzyme
VNPSFVDPDWGVCDLDVFMRAKDEFTALHQQKKPFFGVVLTLSNHAPFNLPKVDGLAPIEGGGDQNQRLNGVHYADWALGQFMSESKKQPWFEDTLFVFVGDHGFGISPTIASIGLLHMHVPLLFYSPSLFGGKAEVRHQVASQLDILPTIVGMMGFQSAHHSYGRDLFRISPQDPGQALVKQSSEPMVGFIRGNDIYVGSATSPSSFHHFDLSFPPSATDDLSAARPDDSKAMMRLLDGLVVSGLQTLEKRRVAPEAK